MNRFELFNPPHNGPDEEPCCDAPDIVISDDGTRVCRNCGVTFGEELVSHERRAYSAEEIRNRRTTEPRWSPLGPRTVITRHRIDAKGRLLPAKKQALFARLGKIQRSLVNSLERNYWIAKPRLKSLATKFAIPDHVTETAWKIYCEVVRQKFTAGRSIEAFSCASLYVATRVYDLPRTLDEICDASLVPVRSVRRALNLVLRSVLPRLDLKYKPVSPGLLVFRFGNDLNLSIGVQKKAARLLKDALKQGLAQTGKDPKGLAVAALYLVVKDSSEHESQAKIAGVAHVTEFTLRSSARQIQAYLDLAPAAIGKK